MSTDNSLPPLGRNFLYHSQAWGEPWPFELPERLQAFMTYYGSLRGADETAVPRHRFDPLAVPDLLPYLQILEAVPQEDGGRRYLFRLQGTAYAAYYGFDATNRCLDEFYPPWDLEAVEQRYDLQLAEHSITYLKGPQVLSGKEFYLFERIMVPFVTDEGRQQLMGCWCWHDKQILSGVPAPSEDLSPAEDL
ncbi:PAS domain-containing protein [Rhodovibrionaceae bacterium A322]